MKTMIREIKTVTKNYSGKIFWSNVNVVIVSGGSLILSVLFARLGDKELYGQYLLILSIVGLLSIISIPGVNPVILKETAKKNYGLFTRATKFSLLWSLIGIPILLLIGILFILSGDKVIGVSLITISPLFPFIQCLKTWKSFLKGNSNFSTLALYNTILFLFTIISIIAALIYKKNIILIVILYFCTQIIIQAFFYNKIAKRTKREKTELKHSWKRQSYSLTILEISSIAFGKIDLLVIGLIVSSSSLAIYGIVMKFTDVFLKLTKSSTEAILPKIYKDGEINIGKFYPFFFLLFLIPLTLQSFIEYPILLLYGEDFSDVVSYSKIYVFAIPLYFVSNLSNHFLIKYNLNKSININKIISIIAVILLYIILIPNFGILGGVIASMFYFLIQAILNIISIKYYIQYK